VSCVDQPAPETGVSETEVAVRSYELDSFSHANHAVFLNYLEYARFEALRTGGLTREAMAGRNWNVYVVRVEVDYLGEARMDDRLVVRTCVEAYRRTSMVLRQEIVRPGAAGGRGTTASEDTIVRARVHVVWIGADGRPMRVPAEVKTALGPGVARTDPSASAQKPTGL